MQSPFRTRAQTWGFILVSIAVVAGSVASIVVAEMFMPQNPAGQQGIITFYRAFSPMILVWSLLGTWAWFAMPQKPVIARMSAEAGRDVDGTAR